MSVENLANSHIVAIIKMVGLKLGVIAQRCGLHDVEAKGPFFTWKGPKWEGLDRVYKRLDRCLCNTEWIEKFENAEVRIVPRICSDHHPILVDLNAER
ncbi:hypothetical protein K1719_021846 [Acacia pycnantha]|nr:hypothetical protein K1719_021846 [Acacia pycnantha]